MSTNIIALEQDLFFAVKIRDTLHHHGYIVTVARNLPAFEEALTTEARPALAIINISTPNIDWVAAIQAASRYAIPVLAFGAHIEVDAQQRARTAGALRVVANSRFAQNMPAIVHQMLQTTHTAEEAAEDEAE